MLALYCTATTARIPFNIPACPRCKAKINKRAEQLCTAQAYLPYLQLVDIDLHANLYPHGVLCPQLIYATSEHVALSHSRLRITRPNLKSLGLEIRHISNPKSWIYYYLKVVSAGR